MGIDIQWPTKLHLLEPLTPVAGLSVFPLVGDGLTPDALTLDEAQEQGKVVIEEQQEGEAVAEVDLQVIGELPVIILEGELLEGALQNRVVNITLLLPPGKHKVPVNCVESGRWHTNRRTRQWYATKSRRVRKAREFEATGTTLDSDIRRRKMRSNVKAMRQTGRARSDQSVTWRAIDAKLARNRVHAEDNDLLELHEARWETLHEAVSQLQPMDGQVGAVVAVADRVVAMEVVGDPVTWRKLWRKVLVGYIGEGLDQPRPGKVSIRAAAEFAEHAGQAQWERVHSPVGRGTHETLDDELTGFVMRDGDTVRHAVVFAD